MQHPILLISLSCLTVLLAQLGMMMYLPALPSIANSLDTTQNLASLTLAVYLVGMALPMLLWGKWAAAVRRLVDRYIRKNRRARRRPAHGHHKTQAVKKRLAEVAPCAECTRRATKPDRCFAAIGRDYSPSLSGARDRDFLGCFTGMKAKRRTKRLILKAKCLAAAVVTNPASAIYLKRRD